MPKNRGYERGVGGHDLTVGGPTGKGGNQGVKEDGAQAKAAAGKTSLSPGTQPGTTINNYGAGVLTKGNIEGGEAPTRDPGVGGVGTQGGEVVGPLDGVKRKTYYVYDHP